MTAPPFRQPWRTIRPGCLAAIAVGAAAANAPAAAQVAIEAAVFSDYRVRGYSISDGNPAASVALSFDDSSGLYLGAVAVGSVRHDGPELAGFHADIGYALRLDPEISLDAGLSRSEYGYAYFGRHLGYTELYLGVSSPHLSARVHYSPDYYRARTNTLYAEVESGIEPATDWFLSAHAGVFTYLDRPPAYLPRDRYDWRIGATRRFGATGIHLDLSGRVQGTPARTATNATALVVSVTHGF